MIDQEKNIFIVGIKGVAMANLALIFQKMNKHVSGSDTNEGFITDELLKKANIKISDGFLKEDLPDDIDLVIYSAAHQGRDNPQVLEAKRRGIKIMSQAQAINHLMFNSQNKIAVCGSHGKTTTSSLLAYSLIKLHGEPSYLVGAPKFNNYPGGDWQSDRYFVVEADEYGVSPPKDKTPKFHFLNPNYIIATNIDFDHPDVYNNIDEVKDVFLSFFKKLIPYQDKNRLFVCADDRNLIDVISRLPQNSYQTFGFKEGATLQVTSFRSDEYYSYFNLKYQGQNLGEFKVSLFGSKNITNAAATILLLINLNFPLEQIKQAIEDFKGAKRRFEKIFSQNNTYLFDDYAHHPDEITSTIKAAKSKFGNKRLIFIFQPHTFSRTKILLDDFAKSLSLADMSLVLPIFPSAREREADFTVTSYDIEKKGGRDRIKAVESKSDLIGILKNSLKIGDVIFTMGAGDVYKLKDDIIPIIKNL